MSTLQQETTQTRRTQPRPEARGLRHSVAGIVAACVLSLMQASATRRERRYGIHSDADW
jgi:hypothetical protein